MPEGISTENLMNSIMETFADPKQKSVPFFEDDKSSTVSSQLNRLFGRQRSVYNIFGGGKSADVLLWRNKKISAGVLTAATAIWVLFEWLNYHFLSLACFGLVLGMLVQFLWSNASGILNRSPSQVPRFVLPDEVFINIAVSVGAELNRFLRFLQDVACGGNLKQFIMVAGSLFAAAVIGSWCSFLTVMYLGFVAAHTLPVLYERYDHEIDGFVSKLLEHLQKNYRKLDAGVLSKIPKRSFRRKKDE